MSNVNAAALAEAEQLYRQGRCDQALALLQDALAQNRSARALALKLAQWLYDAERFRDAMDLIPPRAPEARDPLAEILTARCQAGLADFDAAEESARRYLAADPCSGAALEVLARVCKHRGERAEAEALFREAARTDPLSGAFTGLGVMFWEDGRRSEAIECLAQGVAAMPLAREAVLRLHAAAVEAGAFDTAAAVIRAALDRHPRHRRLRFLWIDLLLRQAKYAAAMAPIEAAMAEDGVDDGLLAAASAVRLRLGPHGPADGRSAGVSLCLIVKNERAHLARCLRSAKPLADEIIVIDTGSEDGSQAIAEAFGAKVYTVAWEEDFAKARNAALAQASGKWVFILDADEIVSARDHEAFRALVSAGTSAAAYTVRTRNYTTHVNTLGWRPNAGEYPEEEAGSGWFPSDKVRLFPNHPEVHFINPVHELVEPSLRRLKIPIRTCPVCVHHYGKLGEARTHEKILTYRKLSAKKIKRLKHDPGALREAAIQASHLGDPAEAIALWRRYARIAPRSAEAWINLGTAFYNLGRFQDAAEHARKAVALDPAVPEAHFNLALAELLLGRRESAGTVLHALLVRMPEYYSARFLAAAVATCGGDERSARDSIEKLKATPVAGQLGDSFLDLGRRLRAVGHSTWAERLFAAAAGCGAAEPEFRATCERRLTAGEAV
jgi:tetratricopeptide (TPR) repeat protein